MPNKCCVPGCRGNYDDNDKVSVFKFPSDPEQRDLWKRKIPRANFHPSKQSVVCVRHFSDQFVIKIDSVTRPDGSVLTVERTRPKLTDDAYPSIFSNSSCPSYLTVEPPAKRKKPQERQADAQKRDENSFREWMEADKIKSFSEFSSRVKDRAPEKTWLCRLHSNASKPSTTKVSSGMDVDSTRSDSYWSFYYIMDDLLNKTMPTLVSTIRVFADMHVEVFAENISRVPDSSLRWVLGPQSPPTLTTWSQFDSMLSHFSGREVADDPKLKIHVLIGGLQDLCSNEKLEETDDDEGSSMKERLQFLVEQLNLLFSATKRYSCETLLWAFQTFASAPQTYSLQRSTVLTLPHPTYLKRIASVFNINSGLKEQSGHEEYLKQKCQNLSEAERNVILMLDEIHVANHMSYKQGRLVGTAFNSAVASDASTAQVFMISSLMCKSKDVVAIIPVKQLTASLLQDLIVKVLELLHTIGYSVVCVISDNNRINRSAFTLICGGNLQLFIPNPYKSSDKLFFLFDTVHLLKCIRNNWLAQKDEEATLLFPSMESSDCVMKASFGHVRKLYFEEKTSLMKLAPALSNKALFPTATEKQNVKLMLKVFDQNNVVALEHYEKMWHTDTLGTRQFLTIIVKLWNILNVKHPTKHIRLRNPDCMSVTSSSGENMQFIARVVKWLQDWKKLNQKPREGTLSRDTMIALEHTLLGLTELANYLLDKKQFKYVLLGRFQTDNLEFRFSQYRQLSGSNFHVSVEQLLEGEKKLKLMSVLQMISSSNGQISLKDITDPLAYVKTTRTATSNEEHREFLQTLNECGELEINTQQLKALVFVSGYTVTKARTDCTTCTKRLMIDRKLQVEGTEDCHTYLSALDRGGLTWPSDFAVNIVTEVFRVFQHLIGSPKNEQQFIQCINQRTILMSLALQRLSDLGLSQGQCDECGVDNEYMVKKCCKPAVNIFLNNYSKNFSDKASSTSARKIKTFTKRI